MHSSTCCRSRPGLLLSWMPGWPPSRRQRLSSGASWKQSWQQPSEGKPCPQSLSCRWELVHITLVVQACVGRPCYCCHWVQMAITAFDNTIQKMCDAKLLPFCGTQRMLCCLPVLPLQVQCQGQSHCAGNLISWVVLLCLHSIVWHS